jgi:hypothetical protein
MNAPPNSAALGRRRWSLAAGWAPSRGQGPEPEHTSCDVLSILNAGERHADVRMRVFYAQRAAVGPFRITVAARRLRRLRVNDLIFPEAIALDEPYGLVATSNVPVLVQFSRQDSRQAELAWLLPMSWAESDGQGLVRGEAADPGREKGEERAGG